MLPSAAHPLAERSNTAAQTAVVTLWRAKTPAPSTPTRSTAFEFCFARPGQPPVRDGGTARNASPASAGGTNQPVGEGFRGLSLSDGLERAREDGVDLDQWEASSIAILSASPSRPAFAAAWLA